MSTEKKTLALFAREAWKYPKYVIGLVFAVPAAVVINEFLPPLIVAGILAKLTAGDFIKGDLLASFGWDIALYVFLLILGGTICWRIVIILIWRLEVFTTLTMTRKMFDHLMLSSSNFHANNFGGSLVSQTNKLVGAYIRIQDTVVFHIYTLIIAFLTAAYILLPKAPLFVFAMLIISIAFILYAILLTKKVRQLNAVEASMINKQTGHLADGVTNVMAVKSFSAREYESNLFAKHTLNTQNAAFELMKATTRRDIVFSSFNTILQGTSIALAAASVVIFSADISVVYLILIYTLNIVHRLWEFSQSTLRNINRGLGDAKEAVTTLSVPQGVKDPESAEESRIEKGAIEFKDMTFSHADSSTGEVLFSNFNLTIKLGEKIGLVGHSGSGKSTLVKLLLRFSDINSGAILIDGQNIAHITQDDLRREIAYVPQEPLLFHRTIRENILYGKPGASEEEIIDAAKRANAHEFIEKLPHGYDTLVGERGVKLSGGQRQRIAIARSIIKVAPILVLDEATSALDSESEQLIQKSLKELMKNRTAIVIAHRLSTIQKMDRIVVLSEGEIQEQGSHEELLAKKGEYYKLWSHQSGGFISD